MNILFLTPAFPPFPGGGERYAFSLANELIGRGHAITVLTSSATTEQDFWQGGSTTAVITEEPVPNLTIIRCSVAGMPFGRSGLLIWRKLMVLTSMLPGNQSRLLTSMARWIPSIPTMQKTLDEIDIKFDIVQVFNLSWEYPMTVGWQYARKHDLPLVVVPYTHLGVEGRDRVARNSTMDHQLDIMRDAACVFTLTTIEEKGLVGLGLQQKQVKTIHGGLERPSEGGDREEVIDKLGVKKPYVLFLGRASFDKGAVHAAEAVCQYNEHHGPLALVLAGQSTPEFERFYHRLSDSEREWIQPVGLVSEGEKQALLAGCEMLLLPSRADSFGIVLLEAWACGKAVIGANAGGIPGVIDNGRNGLLVEFGDVPGLTGAIQEMMKHPARKTALGQAGLEKVNDVYRWEKVGERVEAVYREIVRR